MYGFTHLSKDALKKTRQGCRTCCPPRSTHPCCLSIAVSIVYTHETHNVRPTHSRVNMYYCLPFFPRLLCPAVSFAQCPGGSLRRHRSSARAAQAHTLYQLLSPIDLTSYSRPSLARTCTLKRLQRRQARRERHADRVLDGGRAGRPPPGRRGRDVRHTELHRRGAQGGASYKQPL